MLVAIIASETAGKSIAKMAQTGADNVRVHAYTTVEQFIRQASSQGLMFSRIILVSTIVPANTREQTLTELNRYLVEFSPRTLLFFMTRYTGPTDMRDADAREVFFNIFQSVLYTDISIAKFTEQVLQKLMVSTIEDIVKLYSRRPETNLDVLEDFIELEEPEPEQVQVAGDVPPTVIKNYGAKAGMFKKGKQAQEWSENANINAQLVQTLQV